MEKKAVDRYYDGKGGWDEEQKEISFKVIPFTKESLEEMMVKCGKIRVSLYEKGFGSEIAEESFLVKVLWQIIIRNLDVIDLNN